MAFIVEHQAWLIPMATALLANAFPALPWGRILTNIVGAIAAGKRGK